VDREPLTITAAAPLIRDGQLTPSDLLEQCLARIDRYEAKVRAWVYLDRERARTEAAQLTDKIKQGHYRGPLHGIPVGIKDIIDVFDMPTGCGSKLWANSYARRDAACVRRLRQAGALILGKTVTTAFASFDPPVTRNPWDLNRTPGGSSSGSAAAVACGMCLAALATQTGGSITRPASYCGVASLKPTWGRVSVDGVLPLAPSLDHVGVMANCVRDLAIVFRSIVDPNASPLPGFRCEPDYPAVDFLAMLDNIRDNAAGPTRLTGMFEEAIQSHLGSKYEKAVRAFEFEHTAPLHHTVPPVGFADILAAHRQIMATEAALYHLDRFRRHPEDYPARISQLIEEGAGVSAVGYVDAIRLRGELRDEVTSLMYQSYGPERKVVFITPATTDFAPTAETTGDPAFNSPWSFLGLPTVSVPAGWSDDGLPFAVQLIGPPGTEAGVLAVAHRCDLMFPDVRLPVSV
jgi:aspartyl-tRNA(Asn)/glutamyl-tRNA(Gln) amidotransferase subunit A